MLRSKVVRNGIPTIAFLDILIVPFSVRAHGVGERIWLNIVLSPRYVITVNGSRATMQGQEGPGHAVIRSRTLEVEGIVEYGLNTVVIRC